MEIAVRSRRRIVVESPLRPLFIHKGCHGQGPFLHQKKDSCVTFAMGFLHKSSGLSVLHWRPRTERARTIVSAFLLVHWTSVEFYIEIVEFSIRL